MKQENQCKHIWKRRVSFSLAVFVSFLISGALSFAVDNADGTGAGVAIGTGSSAPKAENVVIGKGAKVAYSGGIPSAATGDISIGSGANINNYINQGGSVAIGQNAKIENMAGGGEATFAFGQTTYSGTIFDSPRIPADPTKAPASVAIGQNTFTRTGGTMVGVHNYKGELGDKTVDSANTRTTNLNVYSTTIGANSHNNAAFATVTGAYSIISSDYNGGRFSPITKGLGATINGALNSIENLIGTKYSGIANTVVGLANRTANSNGSLVFGAGNEITNSFTDLVNYPTDGGSSAKDFAEKLRTSIRDSNSGGSTMAIGGGNKANHTRGSQLIGVNNTLTGTKAKKSEYTLLNGYKNIAVQTSRTTVIGNENNLNEVEKTVLLGEKRTVTGVEKSVILGGAETALTTDKDKLVILGHNANATVDGGIALGADSLAERDKREVGYDPSTQAPSTNTDSTWKATAAALSIGNLGEGMTRQITGLAAGSEDSDAVNVAQLKAAMAANNNNPAPSVVPSPSPNDVIAYKDKTSGELLQKGADGKYYSEKDLQGANYDPVSQKYTKNGQDLKEANPQNMVTTLVNPDKTTDQPSSPLQNVGDGEISETSTDAVNGRQLYATNQKIDDITKDNETMKEAIEVNRQDIHEAKSEIRHVGSLSAALAALHPMQYDPLQKSQVMAGVGLYRDKKAVAVGLAHYFNENLMMTAGVSIGEERRAKSMVNLGLTWKIGSDDDRKELPERYKEGPLGSIYKMQEEMEQVLRENKVLRSELNELKAQMKSLLEKQ